MVIATLLFILPAEKTGLICGKLENGPSRPILTWKTAQSKMNWGVLLIIGGGYAMADASDKSGKHAKIARKIITTGVVP